jgi:hypothetical protein
MMTAWNYKGSNCPQATGEEQPMPFGDWLGYLGLALIVISCTAIIGMVG